MQKMQKMLKSQKCKNGKNGVLSLLLLHFSLSVQTPHTACMKISPSSSLRRCRRRFVFVLFVVALRCQTNGGNSATPYSEIQYQDTFCITTQQCTFSLPTHAYFTRNDCSSRLHRPSVGQVSWLLVLNNVRLAQ